jgi:hypothetical protein
VIELPILNLVYMSERSLLYHDLFRIIIMADSHFLFYTYGFLIDLIICVIDWYVTDSLSKSILQGTVNGSRSRGGQRKTWIDNVKQWADLSVSTLLRAAERRDQSRTLCGDASALTPYDPLTGLRAYDNDDVTDVSDCLSVEHSLDNWFVFIFPSHVINYDHCCFVNLVYSVADPVLLLLLLLPLARSI